MPGSESKESQKKNTEFEIKEDAVTYKDFEEFSSIQKFLLKHQDSYRESKYMEYLEKMVIAL